MLHDDCLCLVESGKQQIKEVRRKFNRKTWKQRQLLSESGFVLRTAPPPLSRDRRIKIKKSFSFSLFVALGSYHNNTRKYNTQQTIERKRSKTGKGLSRSSSQQPPQVRLKRLCNTAPKKRRSDGDPESNLIAPDFELKTYRADVFNHHANQPVNTQTNYVKLNYNPLVISAAELIKCLDLF